MNNLRCHERRTGRRPTVGRVTAGLEVRNANGTHDAVARSCGAIGGALWLAVVAVSVAWPHLSPLDPRAGISAAPFFGRWTWSGQLWTLVATLVGLALVITLPEGFCRLASGRVPLAAGVSAIAWSALLAASTDGLHRLASPLNSPFEYLPFARHIRPGAFLDTFVERAVAYPIHVKGHPPGMVLLFWFLDRVGLAGPGWAAFVVLCAWGVGVAAVVWTTGRLGGDDAARRAAPFVALAPAVVWAATSGDGLIAGVTATAIALMVAAITTPEVDRTRTSALAVGGGLIFGAALFLSYGVAPLVLVPLAVARSRRRAFWLLPAAAGVVAVTASFAVAGFWWPDGLTATRNFYLAGVSTHRSYAYFVLAGNRGALALAVGPATGAGVARLLGGRPTRPDAVVMGAVLIAVVIADLSGMSKAEVERIWLPYSLWIVAGAGAVSSQRSRWWLGAQVALAIGLQAWLVTPW